MPLTKGDHVKYKAYPYDYWEVEAVEGDLVTLVARVTAPTERILHYYDPVVIQVNKEV